MIHKFLLMFTIYLSWESFALVPIENLVLGNYDDDQITVDRDPLEFLFTDAQNEQLGADQQERLRLKKMLGLYLEGENLKSFCKKNLTSRYSSDWEKRLALRSFITTLQFMSLDVSVRSVGRLAQKLNFSKQEYENLTNRLMLNYCSENTTVISLREIRNNLSNEFKKIHSEKNDLKYFPYLAIKNHTQRLEKQWEQELLIAVELFKSSCSWGGKTRNYRLMVPLITDPTIMSLVIRKMSGFKLNWDLKNDNILIEHEKTGSRALCKNTICRLRPVDEFEEQFPLSLGGVSIKDDLERLYCTNLAKQKYQEEDAPLSIKKWIKQRNSETDQLLRSFFVSEVTGIPALDVRAEKYNSLKTILRSSIDKSWTEWAVISNENHIQSLLYEEALTVEVISRQRYWNIFSPKFRVEFDINLGELDRANIGQGKFTADYKLKIGKNFLRWMRREWILRNVNNDEDIQALRKRMSLQISNMVKALKEAFTLPFWEKDKDLEHLISAEILTQLENYRGNFFDSLAGEGEHVIIPLRFHYGPFALKYLGHKAKINLFEKNKKKNKSEQQ